MSINGKSDHNSCDFSGRIKWEPRYTTPQNYRFLKFVIEIERVIRGEVKGWEHVTIQLAGDEAEAWHQRGTLKPGVYIYATSLERRGGDPYESGGKWRNGDYFEYSSFNNSTLVIDHDHEENAGLIAEPVDTSTGKPVKPEEVEDTEGGRAMPTRAASGPTRAPMTARAPARVAARTSSVPVRTATPAVPRAAEPVEAPAPTGVARMAAARTRATPTAEQQKAAAAAVTATVPTDDKYEDEEDIAF